MKLKVKIGEQVELVRFNASTEITIKPDSVFFSTLGMAGLELEKEPSEEVYICFVPPDLES